MTIWQDFLVTTCVHVTVLSMIAATLMAVFPRNAAARHAIGFLCLVLILGSPILTASLPQAGWRRERLAPAVTVTPALGRTGPASVSDSSHFTREPEITPGPAISPDPALSVEGEGQIVADNRKASGQRPSGVKERSASMQGWGGPDTAEKGVGWGGRGVAMAVGLWAAGSLILLARRLCQFSRLRQLVRRLAGDSNPAVVLSEALKAEILQTVGLKQFPPVIASDQIPMPMVMGYRQPRVLLPGGLLQGPAHQLRDVLVHECAHIVRRDSWINASQQLAGVLWWWHPGVRWISSQISRSREEICDNYVLQGSDGPTYAETLLELAERCAAPQRLVPMLGLLGTRWTLEQRIAGLLQPGRNTMTKARRRMVVCTVGALCLVMLVIGGVRNPKLAPASASSAMAADEPSADSVRPDRTRLRTVLIRGNCADEDGVVMAGCKVRIVRRSDEGPYVELAETVSDGEGRFELKNLQTRLPDERDLIVIATADGHVPGVEHPASFEGDVIQTSLKLRSDPGTLSGVVSDSQGKPVAGVAVFFGADQPLPGVGSAVTDEQGRYSISGLQRWSSDDPAVIDPKTGLGSKVTSCFFRLRHPDYALTMAACTAIPQEVNVTLHPPAIVTGRVIDAATNRPAAHVVVSAQGVARSGWFQTRTDDDGQYRLVMTQDHYNLWAHAEDRIAVAIKALSVESGKTVSGADISLVKGGFVVGKVLKNGQPLPEATSPLRVAHYGPARPRTGAAVTSARVNADGTYRLRVAPGMNHVYVMSGNGGFVDVTVEEGREVVVNFNLSDEQRPGFREQDADEEFAARLRRQAENEDARAKAQSSNLPVEAIRIRKNTKVGKLLNRLEELDAGNGRFELPWCKVLKEIVEQGPAAVPELIEELDVTSDRRMLADLGFILRAIGDRRAAPALIRSIPKTLIPPSSDVGCRLEDPVLLKFMHKHELGEHHEKNQFSFGRPVREVFGALHKLTGKRFDEDQVYSIFLEGLPTQQALQRELFDRIARQWAGWWEQHWKESVSDAAYSRVNLPEFRREATSLPQPGTHFKTSGGASNWILESISNSKAEVVFLDLDTTRVSPLPEKWRQIKNVESYLDEILAWAGREGFDVFGAEYQSPSDGKRYFAIRPIGLRAWELGEDRWKMESSDVTIEQLQSEGLPVTGPLLHYESSREAYEPSRKAAFFYLTREGTPGLLYVGIEVLDGSLKPGRASTGDNELDPVAFQKGRRLAWTRLEELPVSKGTRSR